MEDLEFVDLFADPDLAALLDEHQTTNPEQHQIEVAEPELPEGHEQLYEFRGNLYTEKEVFELCGPLRAMGKIAAEPLLAAHKAVGETRARPDTERRAETELELKHAKYINQPKPETPNAPPVIKPEVTIATRVSDEQLHHVEQAAIEVPRQVDRTVTVEALVIKTTNSESTQPVQLTSEPESAATPIVEAVEPVEVVIPLTLKETPPKSVMPESVHTAEPLRVVEEAEMMTPIAEVVQAPIDRELLQEVSPVLAVELAAVLEHVGEDSLAADHPPVFPPEIAEIGAIFAETATPEQIVVVETLEFLITVAAERLTELVQEDNLDGVEAAEIQKMIEAWYDQLLDEFGEELLAEYGIVKAETTAKAFVEQIIQAALNAPEQEITLVKEEGTHEDRADNQSDLWQTAQQPVEDEEQRPRHARYGRIALGPLKFAAA